VEEEVTSYYKASSTNASGRVEEYTIHDVDFINTLKHYGSLIVGKDVNYPEGFVPNNAHNDNEFTINVTFTGDTENMVVPQGVTSNGNTYTIKLKDGQSVTFANIPEGVTYNVSESNLPDGYAMQEIRYSDTDKVINGNDIDTVDVVNNYSLEPVQAKLKVTGTKTVVGGWPSGADFTVRLWQVFDFASGEIIKTNRTATVTSSNANYTIDISSIDFKKVGTYYIRIAEDIPEQADRIPDMAYDRTLGLFSITVTDDNADGKLEIKDDAIVGYQGTPVSGNATDGWVVTKNFTNVVTKDLVYLDIEKNLTGFTGNNPPIADIAFGLFSSKNDNNPKYYDLTDKDGKATIMVPVTKATIEENGGQLVYYLREVAPSTENRVVGMRYDESWIYAIRITWDDVNHEAVTEYAVINNGVVGTYLPYSREQVKFTHTNAFENDVNVGINLKGKKTLNNNELLGGREFSFSLYHSTPAFVSGELIETVENNGNNISFSEVKFTQAGIYYMVAVENASTLGGITIDPTVYHITVEVENFTDTDGTTRLRIVDGYPIVVAFGNSTNVGVNDLNFNNTYTVTGSEDVVIQGIKKLTGKILNANDFKIGLYSDSGCQNLIESVNNLADGSFTFTKLTYTADDLGAGYATKTFTYYVKEINDGKSGITYDDTIYVITVEVKDNGDGTLDANTTVSLIDGTFLGKPEDNVVKLDIENSYSAKPTSAVINGNKILSGDWSAVTNKQFKFELFAADSEFNITDQTPLKTVYSSGNFSMTLNYTDGQEGYYYYILKENTSAKASGVNYDAGEYHITVNVSDPGNGQLVATVRMYRPGIGNTAVASFTNHYSVEPIEFTLVGDKKYTNRITNQLIAQTEGQFTFSVLEDEVLVATGKNLANGNIEFTPITYTAAGVHVYTVVENVGNAGGVTYDDAEFTVTVTVTDNGDGTLSAKAEYGTTPVEFENTYTHDSAQIEFKGKKKLTGDWNAVSDIGKTFIFELYETNEFYTISGLPIDVVQSGKGDFNFATRTFVEEGKYYFVIRELNDGLNGVDYDDTIYRIAVTVTDDGEGHLIPKVTASDPAVTVDNSNNTSIVINGLEFTNHYEAKPAEYIPEAQKIYERTESEDMKEFEFVLTVNGQQKQTKKNNVTNGKVTFDKLTFDTVGTYTLTIREQESTLFGLIRWDVNVYTVTLYVEDDGQGQLFVNEKKTTITSEKGRKDLIFRNANHSVITKKDVFAPEKPTVSIDGKTVENNDILLYKVSYKNFDSVPVDIEIQDIIPQYTTYVEGSADNGGTLDKGTIKWTINDVKPDETVTVSFKVKVSKTNITVTNEAKILEGNNEYSTNEVKNPVKDDKVVKDVFNTAKPTASIDGETVNKGDILLYKITYTNSDDLEADVTITDTIPQYTEYVDGSADNDGKFASGKLTWNFKLDANETKTVTFKVKVVGNNGQVVNNQATGLEGENDIASNKVTNPVKASTESPLTGNNFNFTLWISLLLISGGTLITTIVIDRKRKYNVK